MKKVTVEAGISVDGAAILALTEAAANGNVVLVYNDGETVVHPGDDPQDVARKARRNAR